jgi:hypothetical protein
VKKKPANRRLKRASVPAGDAWAAAAAYGCDMNLLELSLRMTPLQRIRANQDALDLIDALQRANKQRYVKT